MPHQHNHEHTHGGSNFKTAFWIGIILNSSFVVIEFIAGFYYNSLALLSDAGHNLSDVASLSLSLFAFRMSQSKATDRFTYGYHKSTILASLANAVILLIAVGSIGWEAIIRFMHPVKTTGGVIAVVAGIGIVINALSAFFFFKDKDKDLNVKGAYLHLATDALVSLGVVIAGIIIVYTGLTWIDPLISLLIMIVVLYGTWSLLTESLRLSMDAVPEKIYIEKFKRLVNDMPGVIRMHHIHIWAMSTTKNAMTAHLILTSGLSEEKISEIKNILKHELEHHNIHHTTFETEYSNAGEESR
jgi:cobalt-zinc-cadmium efflux system protein